jgi:hypothetical protein
MVALSPLDKERARFHLGLSSTANIDSGDIARFEDGVKQIPSDYIKTKIKELLDRLDKTYENLDLITNDGRSVSEIYAGDINRTVIRKEEREQQQIWWAEYMKLTDRLAQTLACANYNHEGMDRYKHSAFPTGVTVSTMPGAADTSIASRVVAKRIFPALSCDFGYL